MTLPGGALASLRRLRVNPGRTMLAALGIAAAAAMLGAALTVGYGLHTGFDRAADRADLPDVIARFNEQPQERVDSRLRTLPNLKASSYRLEFTGVPLEANGNVSRNGVVHVIGPGRRGYEIVAGHDVGASGEAVVERGVAQRWHIRVGEPIDIGRGRLRVVGVAVSPDNVAFPLAKGPRVYVARRALRPEFVLHPRVNVALIWLNDPSKLDQTLTQARAASFGIGGLRFLTRSGVRTSIDQAAGIVIALLVGFSVIALGSAGVMLAAAAQAEVQRRLQGIGVVRALGFGPGSVAGQHALDAAVLALPAGAAGIAAGALVASGPSGGLLESINELPPGSALLGPLALGLLLVVVLVSAAAAWPAWRAARRPVVEVLRPLRPAPPSHASRFPAGFLGVGMRLAAARRGRALSTVAVLTVSAGVVLAMLGMARLLDRLQNDPGLVGKRYQLTVTAPPSKLGAIRHVPGVQAASPRYVVLAADSFQLAESLKLVAYPGDHAPFEDPPLAEGRRVRTASEAEVGTGIADALGVRPGSELAVELPSGREARFRVVGLVRAFDNDGRVVYTRPQRLLAADPSLTGSIAVKLAPGADQGEVRRRLADIGAFAQTVAGATTRNATFLGVLAALLRAVALVDGLVCLYILVQALALTARERRSAIAVLRAAGARAARGAAGAHRRGAGGGARGRARGRGARAARARPGGEQAGGELRGAAARVGPGQVAIVVGGLLLLALAAAALAGRRLEREPVVAGLRSD